MSFLNKIFRKEPTPAQDVITELHATLKPKVCKRAKKIAFEPPDAQKIIELREGGMTYKDIANQFDLNWHHVYAIVRRMRPELIGYNTRTKPPSKELVAEVIQMRKQIKTYEEIGKTVNISFSQVRKILKGNAPDLVGGLIRIGVKKPHFLRTDSPNPRDQEIIKLREKRMTYEAIGQKYGITRERVRQIIEIYRPDLAGWEVKLTPCPTCSKETRISELNRVSGKGVCLTCHSDFLRYASMRKRQANYKGRYELMNGMRNKGATIAQIVTSLHGKGSHNSVYYAVMDRYKQALGVITNFEKQYPLFNPHYNKTIGPDATHQNSRKA